MLPMGTWFIGTQIAKVNSGESKAKNWGIVKFPHPEGVAAGTTAAQISGLSVNKNSDHQKEALAFIKFVTGAEGSAIVASTGTLPAMRTGDVAAKITSIRASRRTRTARTRCNPASPIWKWQSTRMPPRSRLFSTVHMMRS